MTTSILVVEDHDANRAILRRRLERKAFTVFEACDGVAALTMFHDYRPDIVLMDLSMPNMSGFEALSAIRKMEGGATTPIIALTAHAMDSTRDQCQKSGFDAFLPKPLEFDTLLEIIAALASQGAAAA